MAAARTELDGLLALLDEGFERRSWHGTNLRGALRGLNASQGNWRSGAGRRRIVDITVHCAYWKYTVRRRLRGEQRGAFPLKGSNWLALPDTPTAGDWRDYVSLLAEQHRQLRAALAECAPEKLTRNAGNKLTFGQLVRGVAFHDIYHAGQIQIIKAVNRGGVD